VVQDEVPIELRRHHLIDRRMDRLIEIVFSYSICLSSRSGTPASIYITFETSLP
jgi:hypothetical protein